MQFTGIKISEKKGVILSWLLDAAQGATQETEHKGKAEPMPEFVASIQAFKPYVFWLVPALKAFKDTLHVNGVSLSSTKDGRRGLIVTVSAKIEKASGRPLVMNTPLMHERGENSSDEATGLFGDDIVDLILAAERQALDYVHGKGVQVDAFAQAAADKGEAPATTDDKSADDDLSKKRRRRAKSTDAPAKDFVPGVGQVMNPNETGEPTDENLRTLLVAAGRDVPVDAIARWASSERTAAHVWASITLKAAAGKGSPGNIPEEPDCLKRDATPSLLDDTTAAQSKVNADGWDNGPPKKLDDAAISKVRSTTVSPSLTVQ